MRKRLNTFLLFLWLSTWTMLAEDPVCFIYQQQMKNVVGYPTICKTTVPPILLYEEDVQQKLLEYFTREEVDTIVVLSGKAREISIKKELKQCNSKWKIISTRKGEKQKTFYDNIYNNNLITE